AAERRQTNLLAQAKNKVLPLLLECVHVRLGEDFLQGVEAGRVCRAVGEELAVELNEQAALLKVVAEIARLRVVRALVLVVESVVVHRQERLKRRQAAAAYGLLQRGQTPVCEAAYVPVTLAALLVERTHAFVEPRGHAGEVGLHEGVHNLVDERAAAGLDVHDEGLVRSGVVAVGRRGVVAEEAARVCDVEGCVTVSRRNGRRGMRDAARALRGGRAACGERERECEEEEGRGPESFLHMTVRIKKRPAHASSPSFLALFSSSALAP